MRALKFRAWDKAKKQMFPVSDISFGDDGKALTVIVQTAPKGKYYRGLVDGENGVLMQFTGLKDRHGQEIYEGDIVEVDELYATRHAQVVWDVYYAPGGFWNTEETWLLRFSEDAKGPLYPYCQHMPGENISVIGNIYEHSELLNREN